MIRAWRVIKSRYAAHALDGEGSRLYGSRWSSPGLRVVHASQSLALAILEVVVHLQASTPLSAYVSYEMEFDERLVRDLPVSDLPAEWRKSPPAPDLQRFGDAWLHEASSAVLRVPSAVLPTERKDLINPEHPDFQHITVDGPIPLEIDPRLR